MSSHGVDDGAGYGTASTPGAKAKPEHRDDRIKVTAEFTISDLIEAGSLTFTISSHAPTTPDPLPPTPAEPGDE